MAVKRFRKDNLFLFVLSDIGISITNQNTGLFPTREEVISLRKACEEYLNELSSEEIRRLNDLQKTEWQLENEREVEDSSAIKSPKVGNVYLMQNLRNRYIKIGFSIKDPIHREATLQSQEPEIILVSSWVGTLNDEQRLHNIFSKKRVRGEWFELNNDDLQKITHYFELTSTGDLH